MALQEQLEILQQQLHEATGALNAREVELQQRRLESEQFSVVQAQLAQTQAQLAAREEDIRHFNLGARSEEAERQIAELQAQLQALRNTGQQQSGNINWNDEFQRGRIPDLIKIIPTFNGNSKVLPNWLDTVEKTLRHFDHLSGTESFNLWLQDIRNKVVGEAGDLLASCGTPLIWNSIKAQLLVFYGDKRELSTLLHKLFSLKQQRSSIPEFHSEIMDCFTGISSQVQISSEWKHPSEIIKFVDKLCLEKFNDGLEEPYSSYVSLLQPRSLNQAFNYAMEKANKVARKTGDFSIANKSIQQAQLKFPPPVPMRNNHFPRISIQTPQQLQHNNTNRYINNPYNFTLPYKTQQPYRPPYQQPYQQPQRPPHQQPYQQPQRPPYQQLHQQPFRQPFQNFKPTYQQPATQKPIPMDIDPSIRVNYMNRPKIQPIHCHLNDTPDQEQFYTENFDPQHIYNQVEDIDPQQNYNDFQTEYYNPPQTEPEPEQAQAKEIVDDDLNFQIFDGPPGVK